MAIDILDSAAYPQKDRQVWKKTAIGTLLTIIVFFPLGYCLRVIAAGMKGSDRLPEWDDFVKMLVEGLSTFAVYLVYLLPGALIGTLSFIPGLAGRGSAFSPAHLLSTFLHLGAGVLLVAVFALAPMALARYVESNRLASAFHIKEIVEQIKACLADYWVMTVAMVLTYGLVTALGNWLTWLPLLLGEVVTVALLFYASLIFFHWTGSIYGEHFHKPTDPADQGTAPTEEGQGPTDS